MQVIFSSVVRRGVSARLCTSHASSLCTSSAQSMHPMYIQTALCLAARCAASMKTSTSRSQSSKKTTRRTVEAAGRPRPTRKTRGKEAAAEVTPSQTKTRRVSAAHTRKAARVSPVMAEDEADVLGEEADEELDARTAALEAEWRKMRESEVREAADATVMDGEEKGEAEDAVPTEDAESRHLQDRFPDLAAEYDVKENNEPVESVLVDSARVVSWKCVECNFKWKSGVFVRTCLRTRCPECEKRRNPSLSSELVQLWDHSLNDPCIDPKTVLASSYKSAHWRCPTCSTSYQARIKDMVAEKAKCPSCSMLNLHSDYNKDEYGLLQEWHPLKNGDLQPGQVTPTDQTKLWWLCMACGHEWEATLAARLSKTKRARGKVCPVCHGNGKV